MLAAEPMPVLCSWLLSGQALAGCVTQAPGDRNQPHVMGRRKPLAQHHAAELLSAPSEGRLQEGPSAPASARGRTVVAHKKDPL